MRDYHNVNKLIVFGSVMEVNWVLKRVQDDGEGKS